MLGAEKSAKAVGLPTLLKLLGGHFEDATQLEGARVIDKDLRSAQLVPHLRKGRSYRGRIGRIGGNGQGRPPVLLDLRLDRGEFVFAPGHQSHREAFARKPAGGCSPQSWTYT